MSATDQSQMPSERAAYLLRRYCRRHKTSFWGRNYIITPRLLETIWGDGKKVMHLTPLATRPDYYVFCINSGMETDTDDFHDLLDEIYEALEDQFGRSEEDWTHDNGRTYHKHNDFPAFNDSCGTCWGEFACDRREGKGLVAA